MEVDIFRFIFLDKLICCPRVLSGLLNELYKSITILLALLSDIGKRKCRTLHSDTFSPRIDGHSNSHNSD